MSDLFYMFLGVGIFVVIVVHAFVSPRFEARNTQPRPSTVL